VVFDWAVNTPSNLGNEGELNPETSSSDKINNDGLTRSDNFKPHNYIYKMIETMLPKAMVDEKSKHIRLLEM
jgi:hypothetical protein